MSELPFDDIELKFDRILQKFDDFARKTHARFDQLEQQAATNLEIILAAINAGK